MNRTLSQAGLVTFLGRAASVLSICMYVAYVPQIIDNLNGQQGNPLQPLVTGVNCILWVSYSFLKKDRDWPIIIANTPGIFLGIATFLTAL
ncbi:SemiSWEET family transporter [Levilactobacillus fujinensis]|uniref:SemiSWEET family transporter n=1 Tax=Levilactobacillus fujinensis TaxID=2486024 RepID=A0ABW1TFC3_9LACO|nr:SemiSWEET family transporter [Levilactobacillus fujinensis]